MEDGRWKMEDGRWKMVEYVLSLLIVISGFSGLIAVLEESYSLGCKLVLLTIFLELVNKILVKNPVKFLKFFNFSGGLLWYTGIVVILLWKLFYINCGLIGMGAVIILILAGLTWFTRNIISEKCIGLPPVVSAGLIVSVIMVLLNMGVDFTGFVKLITVLVILISYLMVTNVKPGFCIRNEEPRR